MDKSYWLIVFFCLGVIVCGLMGGCVTKQYALNYGESRYINGKFDGEAEGELRGHKRAQKECDTAINSLKIANNTFVGNYLGLRANIRALINAKDGLSKNPNSKEFKRKYDDIFKGLEKDLE